MKQPCVYHRRRRPRRSGPHHRARPALSRGAPTWWSTTTGSTRGCCAARGRRRADRRRPGGAASRSTRTRSAAARREGARGQDRRPPQVGRSVRVRQRRQGSAVPARAAACRSKSCRASRRRSAAPPTPAFRSRIPEAGDVAHARSRPRGGNGQHRRTSTGQRLAGLDGTLVCYAGARQIGAMGDALLATRPVAGGIGRARSTTGRAVAARRVDGTLATIAALARCRASRRCWSIGAVAGLREHLRWFDDRPLFGRRIVVTRSREQAGELDRHARGARRRGDPGADDPDRAAGRSRAARRACAERRRTTTGSSSPARTRSTTSCVGCWPTATSAI